MRIAKYIVAALLIGSVSSATLNNTCTIDQPGCINVFPDGVQVTPDENCVPFSQLGTPSNGTIVTCCNCTATNPCAAGVSKTVAIRSGNLWFCIPATTTTTSTSTSTSATTTSSSTSTSSTTTTSTSTSTSTTVASATVGLLLPWGTSQVSDPSSLVNGISNSVANQSNCFSFVPPYTINATKIAFRVISHAGGELCGAAIYTISGTTWTKTALKNDGVDCGTANGVKSATGLGPVTLTAGTKYGYCFTSTSATQTFVGQAQFTATSANDLINAFQTNYGTGQASTAGVLPTTASPISSASAIPITTIISAE